ncbi:MAG: hypothetical protein AAGD33_19145 [Actinomycetota bacterium]
MSGTERERAESPGLVPALTTFGAFAYVGWLLFVFQVLERVSQVTASRAAGVWSQRVETLAFLTFMPNLIVIALPAAAAIAATTLAGPTQSLELAILLRLVRWSATAMAAIAVLGVVFVIFEDGTDSLGTIAFRLGGAVVCVGLAQLLLAVGRLSPGG